MIRRALLLLSLLLVASASFAQSEATDLTGVFRAGGIKIDRLLVVKISGIVLIRGTTANATMASRAGSFARDLGYMRVANLIEIVPGSVDTDAEIERLGVHALDMAPELEGCTFQVESVEGVIRLMGDVRRSIQGDLAVSLLSRVAGVSAVNSEVVTGRVHDPRELLARYVADLQKAPEDQMLRERIIRLSKTLSPPLAVPQDALRLFATAASFEQEAADMRDSAALAVSARDFAIASYRKALLIAPWWPEAYSGLGASLDGAGRFDEANAALLLVLIAQPDPAGVSAATVRMRAIAARRLDLPPTR